MRINIYSQKDDNGSRIFVSAVPTTTIRINLRCKKTPNGARVLTSTAYSGIYTNHYASTVGGYLLTCIFIRPDRRSLFSLTQYLSPGDLVPFILERPQGVPAHQSPVMTTHLLYRSASRLYCN